jgi:hypothetical protein
MGGGVSIVRPKFLEQVVEVVDRMIGANSPDEQPTLGVGFGIKDHPDVTGPNPPERSVLLKRLALSERIGFKSLQLF